MYEFVNHISPFEHNHHVVAAIWFDFSFGLDITFSVADVLNSLFFNGERAFILEKSQEYGQLASHDLLETAICLDIKDIGPLEIWNLRGNAMLNGLSKYLDLIFDSANSILIFTSETNIPMKYTDSFQKKLDVFKGLTSGNFHKLNIFKYGF